MNNSPALLHITVLSLFPEMFPGPLQYSLAGKGLKENIWSLSTVNIKDFGIGKHKQVDDHQYGGGSGLVLKADVLGRAIDYCIEKYAPTALYYPSPRGSLFNQSTAKAIIEHNSILILCGRFEGIDQRVIDHYQLQEISMGDFILSGGEIAALAMMDTCVRLLPGIVRNEESLREESFGEGVGYSLLEYPLYTRPHTWQQREVPEVLISGNHARIRDWRYNQAMQRTKECRPDLLQKNKID